MLSQLLHSSQWCYRHGFPKAGALFEKLMILTCSADISGRAKIHRHVSFSHGGIGVVVHPGAEIGEGCIISTKVTLGNGFPHGGAPKLGRHVYIGTGAFVGGGIFVADNVIVGAGTVLTKDVFEPGVVVCGVPGKIRRKLKEEEIEALKW